MKLVLLRDASPQLIPPDEERPIPKQVHELFWEYSFMKQAHLPKLTFLPLQINQ